MQGQAPSGTHVPPWPRAAIHDTVASIVRQSGYRRDWQRTLLDRIMRWISDLLNRFLGAMRGVPHGREIAVVGAALLVLLIATRVMYARRLRASGFEEPGGPTVEGRIRTDPLREAERLAAAGQFTEAAHALYRAVVAALSMQGLVRPHPSKTSGDYTRELRRRDAPAEAPFRRFGSRYDRIIYGTGVCDAEDYTALLEAARAVFAAAHRERAA